MALDHIGFQKWSMSLYLQQVGDEHENWKETIENCQKDGYYVPDEIVLPTLDKAFASFGMAPKIVIDGGTRTVEQAKKFYGFLTKLGYNVVTFFIDCPRDICLARSLERKRADDTEEIIHRRFAEYDRYTVPAVEFMKQTSWLVPFEIIDASQPLEARIISLFKPLGQYELVGPVTAIVERELQQEEEERHLKVA